MNATHRIIVNVVVTYGRSLYGLALGLFTTRWVLLSLGTSDFGLYGLVGGLTIIVSFLNELLSMSVARFYAVSVGAAKKAGNADVAIDECRMWFNSAASIHFVLPLFLMFIGYPLGIYIVTNFLKIPTDRIVACQWVWRFTCISCFIGMVNVPFRAMYTAKQEIAELTVYSFISATLNALMLFYMVTHPGVWLVKYAFGVMLIGVLPQLLIAVRALNHYPECKVIVKYMWCWDRIKKIILFAFARFWTELSNVLSRHGIAILVNKYLGATFNASVSLGNTVAGQASSLSGSLSGAFWPAIVNKAGEGDIEGVKSMSFTVCRIGAVLLLCFAIPLILEIDEIMLLWLKTPPEFVSIICVVILLDCILDRMTDGYWMAILGLGCHVGVYSCWAGSIGLFRFLVAWGAFVGGMGIYGLCVAWMLARIWATVVRVALGKRLVGMNGRYWIKQVCVRVALPSVFSYAIGYLMRFLMPPSCLRICMTTCVCEIVFLPLIWFVVLASSERRYVLSRVSKILFEKRLCK